MLTLKIRIFIMIIMAIDLGYVINLIRKKSLEIRYALVWLFSGIVILLLAIFPGLITLISKFFGIYSPVNTLFFFGFCLSLMIIFSLTVFASRMSIRIKNLTQEVAIKNKQIEDLLNKINEKSK